MTVKENERQATDWEEIFAKDTAHKRTVTQNASKLKKLNSKQLIKIRQRPQQKPYYIRHHTDGK